MSAIPAPERTSVSGPLNYNIKCRIMLGDFDVNNALLQERIISMNKGDTEDNQSTGFQRSSTLNFYQNVPSFFIMRKRLYKSAFISFVLYKRKYFYGFIDTLKHTKDIPVESVPPNELPDIQILEIRRINRVT